MATHEWSDIKRRRFSENEIAASKNEAEAEVLEINLRTLCEVSGKTESEVAEILKVTQHELSQLERRDDHVVSILRRYVEALGGELNQTEQRGTREDARELDFRAEPSTSRTRSHPAWFFIRL